MSALPYEPGVTYVVPFFVNGHIVALDFVPDAPPVMTPAVITHAWGTAYDHGQARMAHVAVKSLTPENRK